MSIFYNRPSFDRKDQKRYYRIHCIPILIWITYLTEPIVLKLNVRCIFVLMNRQKNKRHNKYMILIRSVHVCPKY